MAVMSVDWKVVRLVDSREHMKAERMVASLGVT